MLGFEVRDAAEIFGLVQERFDRIKPPERTVDRCAQLLSKASRTPLGDRGAERGEVQPRCRKMGRRRGVRSVTFLLFSWGVSRYLSRWCCLHTS